VDPGTKPKGRERLAGCLAAVILGAAVAACTGEIGGAAGRSGGNGAPNGSSGGGGPGASGTGDPGSVPPGPGAVPPGTNPGGVTVKCDANAAPGVTPLLKLSTLEYRNTVRDLLGATGAPTLATSLAPLLTAVPDDSLGSSFRVLDDRISLEHVQAYFDVGVAVGNAVRDDPAVRRAVGGECALAATLSDACISDFIDGFARLAYRRPLEAADAAQLRALNDGKRTAPEALRAMTLIVLSSPRFVNHVEIDGTSLPGKSDQLQLTAYEIASRLSYLYWQTMPDEELFAAAEDGSLATHDGFEEQLDRVFRDPRTKATLFQFWNEWFRLEKFTGFEVTRPGFVSLAQGEHVGEAGHDYYGDMVQEVQDLTEAYTFGATRTLSDLLQTRESVTKSADLARLYGVAPWSGKGAYPSLPDGTRQGLLQRAALMVSNLETTNPFHRGALVRRNVLCDALPQPDPNSLPPGSLDPPPITAAQTTRQRYQAKIEGKSLCAGCHDQFAAIGYVYESFDALGRYRTIEHVFDEKTGNKLADLPIDTTGVVHVQASDERPVANAAELNQRLLESGKVEPCMASKYFSFATRRAADPDSLDACSLDDLAKMLADPKGGIVGAFRRIALQDSFFARKVGPQ
jgi:hypothetical protein